MGEEEEELSTETHEQFNTLITKTVLAVRNVHLYGSSLHDGSDVPKFHYYGFHTVGLEFDDDMLMTIGKTGIMKRMMNPTIYFRIGEGI